MCIAIYKPAGCEVTDLTLETCWQNNPDGMGFMYVKHNKIVIVKELKNFDRFLLKYEKAIKANPECDFVLHFRIATSGIIDLTNCHPFRINQSLAFCHNGIIAIETKKHVNDTRMFMKQVLRRLPDNWLTKSAIRELVEYRIGQSKFIFLDSKGTVSILSAHMGLWDNGVWFSNHTYKETYFTKWGFDSDGNCEICSMPLLDGEIKYCEPCIEHYKDKDTWL